MMVIEFVTSSIIMLPYCKSLWQKPIRWCAPGSSFSNIEISSSMVSKQKALASSGRAKLLAAPSQFLKHWKKKLLHLNCRTNNEGAKITLLWLRYMQLKLIGEKKILYWGQTYRNLSHRRTFFGPGISRSLNSFILDAIRADISGSCRSDAESVWKSQIKQAYYIYFFLIRAYYIYFRKGIWTLQFVERTKQPISYWPGTQKFQLKRGKY